jgi:apolipoprotein D and lipocalin family protein
VTPGIFVIISVLLAAPETGQAPGPVRTVDAVDLDRYVGAWFEIARYPNSFQDKCLADVTATYSRRSDGRIDVINRCRGVDGSVSEAKGIARVVDSTTSAKLKVRFAPGWLSFLPFVWGDYWILGLAGDYTWAVVGSPDRKYLWVLARKADLNGDAYASALAVASANGFEPGRLVKTSHTMASK